MSTQTISKLDNRDMLIKFNIHRAVVRIERLNTETSSCQPVRADSSHNKHYQCTQCGKRFTHKANQNVHIAADTREASHACVLCDSCLETQTDVDLRSRNSIRSGTHACNHCGKSFTTNSKLCQHVRTHAEKKPQSSSQCDGQFSDTNHFEVDLTQYCGEVTFMQSVQQVL